MQRRLPQPVKVGFLIGLPILDWDDSTIGMSARSSARPTAKSS